jgi:DNA-binding GntR family transcriptional regulator
MTVRNSAREDATTSAQQQAYLFLRDQIQLGRLAGGSRIKPEDIATELGISRMPVREAIRQLDTEGLLTIRPNRGAVVTVFSADRLSELFEMRAVLEGLCARRAAVDFDEDAGDELTLLLNRLNRASGNIDLWIQRHEAFHDFICERARRPHVMAEVRKLRAAVEPYLRLSQTHPVTMGDSARQHKELIDVLLTRDPDKAEAVMRHHIDSTAAEFIPALGGSSEVSR